MPAFGWNGADQVSFFKVNFFFDGVTCSNRATDGIEACRRYSDIQWSWDSKVKEARDQPSEN
jgi:hypothetical protein